MFRLFASNSFYGNQEMNHNNRPCGDAKNREFFDIQVRIFGQMESSHLFPLLFFITTLGSHWWSPDLLALRSSLTYRT